jgi:hypothetical protein
VVGEHMAAQVNNATPFFDKAGYSFYVGTCYAAGNYDFTPDLTGNYTNFKLN